MTAQKGCVPCRPASHPLPRTDMLQLGVLVPVVYLLHQRPYRTSLFSLVRDGQNSFQRLEGFICLKH